ncbi:MAG: hypothetical protein ACMUIS_06895 [bacterium]
MLEEFWEFDRKMIHEKYRALVEELEESECIPNIWMTGLPYMQK